MSRPLALIVDDEPDIRELLEITLGRMNIDTRAAEDLRSAQTLLFKEQFDLCLTDMRLPDGNGIELVELIGKRFPQLPVAVITGLLILAIGEYISNPEVMASPLFHLFSGSIIIGAFFIATDPVTAATTTKGRIYYGLMIGMLVYVIRSWGGYPDGVAFAVLLANMCVPFIDYYTQPRIYGSQDKDE